MGETRRVSVCGIPVLTAPWLPRHIIGLASSHHAVALNTGTGAVVDMPPPGQALPHGNRYVRHAPTDSAVQGGSSE